jgi:hypothetical protein
MSHSSSIRLRSITSQRTKCFTVTAVMTCNFPLFHIRISFQSEDDFPKFINIINVRRTAGDSSLGIATGHGLDDRGSIFSRDKRFFSCPQCQDRLWGPPSLLFNGYRGVLSTGVKRERRQADDSPSSSAEIKNGGSILPHTSS